MLRLYIWRVAVPGITYDKVDEYMLSILPPRDSVMQEMEAEAAKRDIPIVGPAVGRVLYQYELTRPRKHRPDFKNFIK